MTPPRGSGSGAAIRICPHGRCDGSGWIVADDNTASGCECRDRRIARARTLGVNSVIPARYRAVSFDAPPISNIEADRATQPAVQAVREYVGAIDKRLDDGEGFWLMGDVGTGKTSLAMLISKQALAAGRTVAIYSVPALLSRIRRTYDADAGEETFLRFFERLTSVDLLHLDDLGAERATEWVLEQLYAIINERYEEKRAILLTTNLDQAELEEQIGARSISRLVEICGHWILPLNGQDMRMVG